MKYLSIFLFFFIKLSVYSQTVKDTSVYKLNYLFRHMTDTTMPKIFREENMVLYVGKKSSQYSSWDQFLKDSLMKKQYEQGDGLVINASGKKTTNTKLFINSLDRTVIQNERLIKDYFYSEPYPEISWDITPEVKNVGNWKCTKAQGYFKGRKYEVWFTTEIPATGGPWKLIGLPGVVLEASDEKRQIEFVFMGIQNNYLDKFIIDAEPNKAIKINKKDFLNMKEAAQNDPLGFINSTAENVGSGLKISSENSSGNFKPKKLNNPIELKEK